MTDEQKPRQQMPVLVPPSGHGWIPLLEALPAAFRGWSLRLVDVEPEQPESASDDEAFDE